MIVAGIDIGSVSTETVLIDEKKQILSYNVISTGSNSRKAAEISLDGALALAKLARKDIKYIISTGYGRNNVRFADKTVTEIPCHAEGARTLFNDTRTILDIGGQDSKAISLEPSGEVADFAGPVGSVIGEWRRPNGLRIKKVRTPIGVVLIIYEARPNVTSDCAGLLFKTSNVGILKGGSDSLRSNLAIAGVLKKAAAKSGINFDPFFVVEKTQRHIVDELLKENEHIDLVIPRGGETLIRSVTEKSRIPVIKHYKGVCHIYVDDTADLNMALKICVNAKVQRPGVCNAVEKILVHKNKAGKFLPKLKGELDKYNVEIRGDETACKVLKEIKKAVREDWYAEYLDLIVAVKTVKDLKEAIEHINHYGSHHTDSIVTGSKNNAKRFLKEVDSACVFHNISTRFSDGYQFGLGAEIGISTDKIHARGPMGLEELTTYKWVVEGNGQVRT